MRQLADHFVQLLLVSANLSCHESSLIVSISRTLQGDYLYPVVLVAFGETELSAQRITSVYSFVSVLTGIGLGFVVRYVRHLKPFIIFGACMFTTAFGVLIEFRGGEGDGSGSVSGMIGGQFLLGFAGGFISYPTQASVQAASKHENVAMITSLYLAVYQIGSASKAFYRICTAMPAMLLIFVLISRRHHFRSHLDSDHVWTPGGQCGCHYCCSSLRRPLFRCSRISYGLD